MWLVTVTHKSSCHIFTTPAQKTFWSHLNTRHFKLSSRTSDYWETLTIFKSPQLQEDLLAFEKMWEKIQIQGRKKRPKGPKKWPNIPTEFLLTFVCWLTHEYLKSFLLNQSSDGQTSEKSDWCFGKWQKNISDSQHNIWYDAFDIFQKCFILINFKTLDSTFRKTSLGPRRIFFAKRNFRTNKIKAFLLWDSAMQIFFMRPIKTC